MMMVTLIMNACFIDVVHRESSMDVEYAKNGLVSQVPPSEPSRQMCRFSSVTPLNSKGN
jgi:hypothetical protein